MTLILKQTLALITVLTTTITSCFSCAPLAQRRVVSVEVPSTPKLYNSVAKVASLPIMKEGKEPRGAIATAWAIDKDHLVTAGHFCDGVLELQKLEYAEPILWLTAVDIQGRPVIQFPGIIKVSHVDGINDVCVILSPGHPLAPLPVEEDLSLVQVEDPISTLGAPRGFFMLRRDGTIWAVADDGILLSLEVQSGNSGGPVVWQGRVIGIIIYSIPGLNEGGIALRSDVMMQLIREHLN